MEEFYSTGRYADWLASKNTIEKINGNLFLHGGLEEWAIGKDLGKVNQTIRNWITYYQGKTFKEHKIIFKNERLRFHSKGRRI